MVRLAVLAILGVLAGCGDGTEPAGPPPEKPSRSALLEPDASPLEKTDPEKPKESAVEKPKPVPSVLPSPAATTMPAVVPLAEAPFTPHVLSCVGKYEGKPSPDRLLHKIEIKWLEEMVYKTWTSGYVLNGDLSYSFPENSTAVRSFSLKSESRYDTMGVLHAPIGASVYPTGMTLSFGTSPGELKIVSTDVVCERVP